MYIGSLKKYIKSYSFTKRGTKLPFEPEVKGENSDIFNGGSVIWGQLAVLNTGVDLHIELSEVCFVDSAVVTGCTGAGDTRIFIEDQMTLKCVAKARPGENPVAGVYTDKLVIRFEGDYKTVTVKDIDITGAVFDELNIYPQPAAMTFDAGEGFKLADASGILCDMEDADCLFAAEYFKTRLENEHGITLEIKPLGSMFRSAVIFKKDIAMANEHYRVRSMPRILSAMAGDRLGLVYAAVTLLSAVRGKTIRPITVNDKPYMPFRGAHFGLPRREQIPFFKKVISELLVPMKYNTLFIEVAGGMRYDSHPEITEAWNKRQDDFEAGLAPQASHAAMVCGGRSLEKDEVRDIVEYAKSFGLEVIPEIQSLSHVQYITMAHPEIGEEKYVEKQDASEEFSTADIRKDTKAAHNFCAADPRSYEILFDIAEEVIEVFKPKRYVHMGHDEVYEIGVCERCRHRDPAELLAEDINKIYEWLKKRGLKMMIWSDMINATSTTYKTTAAADMIPKDIVCLDFTWYFHFADDIEDNLLEKGFKVMVGNLYSSHHPRCASRIAKDGMVGGEVSMWVDTSEYQLAYEGKLYDLLYTAGLLWREGYEENARRAYDKLMVPLIHNLREKIRGESEYFKNTDELLSEDSAPLRVAGPYAIGSEPCAVELRADNCYDAIAFIHAADRSAQRIAWKSLLEVGRYVVTYEDGSEVVIPIEYGGNIRSMDERHAEPLKPAYYRHEGYIATYLADPISSKNEDGGDVTLYRYQWKNPAPQKKIVGIKLEGSGETDVRVLLYGIEGLYNDR